MSTVSVIIPLYNGEEWIEKCVSSVINQTYNDIEIIIVDDCSTDDSPLIVRSFKDSRIKFIQNNKNRGVPATRNTGIKKAEGRFIGFLDQDDYWHQEKLELHVNEFQQSSESIGVVYGDAMESEPSGESYKVSGQPIPKNRQDKLKKLYMSNPPITVTSLIKKECFEKKGLLNEQLYGCDDYEFWLRIAEDYDFKYISDILAYKKNHGGNTSNNVVKMTDDRIKVAKEYKRKYPISKGTYEKRKFEVYLLTTYNLLCQLRFREASKFSIKTAKVTPGMIINQF